MSARTPKATSLHSRALSPKESRYVQKRLQALVDERHTTPGRGGPSALSRESGMRQQTIDSVLKGGPVGRGFAGQLARFLGLRVEQLLSMVELPEPLDALLQEQPSRWRRIVVDCVRPNAPLLAHGREWTEKQWAALLDQLENVLPRT